MLSLVGRIAILIALTALPLSHSTSVRADEDTAVATEASETDDSGADHGDDSDHEGAGHDESHGDDHSAAGHGAAGHGGDGHGDADAPPLLQFDFGSAICNLAIFLGVLAILSKFVWPVILDGLKARESKIHGDLEAAEKANAEAKALLADYQTKLDDAANQVQAMLTDARKDSEASGQRIIEEAKAEAARQRERAIAEIETAKQVAISELAGQTSDMAMSVAKQVVGRELKASDHADLIRQSLDGLPSNN